MKNASYFFVLFFGAPLLTLRGLKTLLKSSCNAIDDEFHVDTGNSSVDPDS